MAGTYRHIEDDVNVMAAIREGRAADDIFLLDCPWCGEPSYYNQGSHFTCRICDRSIAVVDDDSRRNTQASSEDSYTLAEYWETAPYPPDRQEKR